LEGGPPCFPQTHRGSWYSGSQPGSARSPLQGSHLLRRRFPTPSGLLASPFCWSYNPCSSRKTTRFGLVPPRSPLLRESRLISLRRATEMFQFAHCPPSCLCLQQAVSRHHSGRVAPFGFSGLVARMQLPLNVSPVSASFFGLQRLGILRVLSLACALLVHCVLASCSRTSRASPARLCPGTRTLAFPLLLSLLSSCLGNIEVIMLFGC
jgi:hypothetical protein